MEQSMFTLKPLMADSTELEQQAAIMRWRVAKMN
jgi:hypothetical protein